MSSLSQRLNKTSSLNAVGNTAVQAARGPASGSGRSLETFGSNPSGPSTAVSPHYTLQGAITPDESYRYPERNRSGLRLVCVGRRCEDHQDCLGGAEYRCKEDPKGLVAGKRRSQES